MSAVTLNPDGQITLPEELREELGLKVGYRVRFVRNQRTGRYEILPNISVRSLEGILHRPGMKPVTIEQMNEDIAAEGSRKG